MDAGPEIGHEIPERSRFPPLVERFQAFGDAIGRWRYLIGIDGVQLPSVLGAREFRIPEDERPATDRVFDGMVNGSPVAWNCWVVHVYARFEHRWNYWGH